MNSALKRMRESSGVKRIFVISTTLLVFVGAFISYKNNLFAFGWSPTIIPASVSDTASVNGLRALNDGEFAILSSGKVGDNSKISKIQVGGREITLTGEQSRTIIEGKKGINTYVSSGSNTAVYSNTSVTSKKIDSEIVEHFKTSSEPFPVIVSFNDTNQASGTVAIASSIKNPSKNEPLNRKQRLKNNKDSIRSLISQKSNLNKDLSLVNAVSGKIDLQTYNSLKNSSVVKRLETDKVAHVLLDTSTADIHANEVWQLADNSNNPLTGKGKVIAVIDSGVDYTLPDLGGCFGVGCKVIGGYDFVNNDSNPMDDHGHGTHVAATAAGRATVNGTVLNGVAPDASIIAYKVCNSSASCAYSDIIRALEYSMDPNQDNNTSDHVDVATISIGGPGNPDDSLSLAVDAATAAGVVVTVAAGNSGPTDSTINTPGTARTAITVGASCKPSQIGTNGYCNTAVASFSSRGPLVWNDVNMNKPDVVAPGVLICAARWSTAFAGSPTCFDSHHIRISGTSMATPHVAGAAAIILQAHPDYTPAQVKQLLKANTDDLGLSSDIQGVGKINLLKAIPNSFSATVSPSVWEATSSPSTRFSTTTKTFSITATDAGLNTLDVSTNLSATGVSVVLHKTSLNVSGNGTDSLIADIVVDNNIAVAGNVNGSIVFSSSGVTKSIIPLFITITPTISIDPQSSLDYGFDNPSNATWISSKNVTITNLRTDKSQSVNITKPSVGAGITFNASVSLTIPANSSVAATTSISVNNSLLANGSYSGVLTFSNSIFSSPLTTSFKKFYVLILENNDTPMGLTVAGIWIHDQNNEQYVTQSAENTMIFYLNHPGPYDVLSTSQCGDYGPGSCSFTTVATEGVLLSSTGMATVTQTWANAVNKVSLKAYDENGSRISAAGYNYNTVDKRNSSRIISVFNFQNTGEMFYSNISSNYSHEDLFYTPASQPASKLYYFGGKFDNGINGDITYDLASTTLNKIDVYSNANYRGTATPLLYGCDSFAFCTVRYYGTLDLPNVQTIYSTLLGGQYFKHMTDAGKYGCPDPLVACNSLFHSPFFDTAGNRLLLGADALPVMQESVVYDGLGPSFWYGKFENTSTAINLFPLTGYNNNYFVRQDYSIGQYDQVPYTVSRGGSTLSTGNLPAYLLANPFECCGTEFTPVTITSGQTKFALSIPYQNNGIDLTGSVEANFNTSLSDKNPPSLKRVYFFTNEHRSEQYDAGFSNRLEFELDPVGGSIQSATANVSTDGTTFSSLSVTNNDGVYSASLPESLTSGSNKISLRITATDNSSNNLKYTFQLPLINTVLPTLSISDPSSITRTSARLNSSVTDDGGASTTVRGFEWGLDTNYGNITVENGTFAVGSFSANVSPLVCATTYHWRAYAVNSVGTTTSDDSTVTTLECGAPIFKPTITTNPVSSVSTSTAILNAVIVSAGGEDTSRHGFAYGTGSDLSTVISTSTVNSNLGATTFTQNLTGLTPGTTYYSRAYSVNSAGTSTGSIVSFTTAAITVPIMSTSSPSSLKRTSIVLHGSIVSDGNASSSVRGFRYGPDEDYGTLTTENGNFGAGAFQATISNLNCGTTYHWQSYAINRIGDGYSEDSTFTTLACINGAAAPDMSTSQPSLLTTVSVKLNGIILDINGESLDKIGFEWGKTIAYGASTTQQGSFTENSFNTSLNSLSCGTTYHYRSYGHNSAGYGYGDDVSFTTQTCTLPTISVSNASSISSAVSTLNGSVSSDGGSPISTRGFNWGINSNYKATTTESGSFGSGNFSSTLTGLSCGTQYFFRSYSINGAGVAYSPSSKNFITSSCPVPPPVTPGGSGGGGGGGGSTPNPVQTPSTPAPTPNVTVNTTGAASSPVTIFATPIKVIPKVTINSLLSKGDQGPNVSLLQSILSSLGFFNWEQTGYFGSKTEMAVKAYQESRDLPPVGRVGPMTLNSLNNESISIPTVSLIPTSTPKPVFSKDLKVGDIDEDVRKLQKYLNEKKYTVSTSGPGSIGKETNSFGQLTKQALINFQLKNMILPADGMFSAVIRSIFNK